jgi:sirohydrochlorin cobaltochelatase
MKPGLLLFAHGARDPRWALPFEAVLRRVRQAQSQLPARLAYLEFMSPNLAQAGAELVASGCDHIDVLPLFLGAGGHVRKDLPLLLEALRAAHPGLSLKLHPSVGEVEAVVAAMAQAALDVALAVGVDAGMDAAVKAGLATEPVQAPNAA